MSNRLIDVLDDEKKIHDMNKNYHYRQNVIPKLNKLYKRIWDKSVRTRVVSTSKGEIDELGFVKDLTDDLNDNPHHRLTSLEMKKCNDLWRKYKITMGEK